MLFAAHNSSSAKRLWRDATDNYEKQRGDRRSSKIANQSTFCACFGRCADFGRHTVVPVILTPEGDCEASCCSHCSSCASLRHVAERRAFHAARSPNWRLCRRQPCICACDNPSLCFVTVLLTVFYFILALLTCCHMAAQGHKPVQAARPHSCSYSCAANSGLFRCVTTYHLLNKLHIMISGADLCTHHTPQDHLHQLHMFTHSACLDRSAAAGVRALHRALHSAYPSCIARLPRLVHSAFTVTVLIHQ